MRFTTSDGLSLDFSDAGEGGAGQPPVLCLPGLTRNRRDFDELVAARGDRHRMICLTFRGRGNSDRDPEMLNYNPAVEARDVVELLDHLGVPRVVVVGTSRGGLVSMVLAAAVRDRLAGVLLNDIGPELAPDGLAQIMTYLGVVPRARTHAEAAQALAVRMGAEFPGVTEEKWLDCARRWFDEGDGGLALNYDARLRDMMQMALDQDPPADLWPLFDAFAGLPLAVLRGANSRLLSRETLAEMQARRPDMIVAEVPDRGHVPFLDEPEALTVFDALMARAAA